MKFNRMTFFIIFVLCFSGIISGVFFLLRRPNSGLSTARVAMGATEFNVEVADTVLSRTRGLSGRDGLLENGGMLFVFGSSTTNGFWMKGMKFPIDIVWIREGNIVGFTENAEPEPGKALWFLKIYYPPQEIDAALELRAGVVKKYGLKSGDAVFVQRY